MARKRAINTATIDSIGEVLDDFCSSYKLFKNIAREIKTVMGGIALDADSLGRNAENANLHKAFVESEKFRRALDCEDDAEEYAFLEEMKRGVGSDSKNAIVLYATILAELSERIDKYENTISKLDERIALTEDKSSPEVKIAIRKKEKAMNMLQIYNHRKKVTLVAFFKLRNGMMKAIVKANKRVCDIIGKNNPVAQELVNQLSVTGMMDDIVRYDSIIKSY